VVIDMNESSMRSIDQVRGFVSGAPDAKFSPGRG
jgi:hypothetical protein